MNYLTHLFLSKRTPMSYTGNLMGDFKRELDVDVEKLPEAVQLGINNHRYVDKVTDTNSDVKELRNVFSKERRRYAGVISDIAFDYFLIKHWSQFETIGFDEFTKDSYQGLMSQHQLMPDRMQYVVGNIVTYDWLKAYASLEGIGKSIDMVSKRIRFKNNLAGGVEEIKQNYAEFEAVFLSLFPILIKEVDLANIES